MPGRYHFPRPSRRLRQTRLEPRERQQKLQSHDLPVNRRSVLDPEAPARDVHQPRHLHKGLSGAYKASLAAVPVCIAECRSVRVNRVLDASRTSLCWFYVGCSGHQYARLAGDSSRAALNWTIRSTRPTISGQSARTVTPCSTGAGQRPHGRREHVQPGNSEREARAATATIPMIDAYQFGPRSRNKSPGRSSPFSSPNGKWLDVRPPARHPAVLRTGRARAGTLRAVTIVGLDLNRTLLAVWTAGRCLTRLAGDLYAIAARSARLATC